MEEASYKVYVDWDGDGDFLDAGEDVTDDFYRATISRGFNDPLARVAQVGRATIILHNRNKQYSPELHANVLPRRAVRIDMTYSAVTKIRFTGYLDDIIPTSGLWEERKVTLSCSDAMVLLDQGEGQVALETDVVASDIIEDVVAAVYTPASTRYDDGLNVFPVSADRWAWTVPGQAVEEIKASGKIGDACVGDWGNFFIARDGVPTFYNRHRMPLDTTTVLTLDGTMVGLGYRLNATGVYNIVNVKCHPRAVGTVYEVLGRISQDEAPSIDESGGTRTFVLQFRDPANQEISIGGMDCLTPVAGTDYICTKDPAGEGAEQGSVNASATFYGDHAEVTLTNNNAFPVYVQKLQVRGYAVRAREPVTIAVEDATSRDQYGRRTLSIDAVLMSSPAHAQALADYLLDRYKDPSPIVSGVSFVANRNATMMAAARDLELCQRVDMSESQTGLSSHVGYIWGLVEVLGDVVHQVTFGIVEEYDVGDPFLIGDTFDSGHVMIY